LSRTDDLNALSPLGEPDEQQALSGRMADDDLSPLFKEAITVFGDPLARIFNDPDHSTGFTRGA